MGNANECRTLVKNLVKENFLWEKKKKTINVLTIFFISHKSDVKTFLKWILSQCPNGQCVCVRENKINQLP